RAQTVVDAAALVVHPREVVALIGKSGSGQSTIASTVLRLLPGDARVRECTPHRAGIDVLAARPAAVRRTLARSVGYVPQDPGSALNPVRTIRSQFFETVRAKRALPEGGDLESLAIEPLARVGIPEPERILDQYPHQLSGGL